MTTFRYILMRRIVLLCAAASLLAPAVSLLAVDLHERLAAHHEMADHDEEHRHAHGVDGHPESHHRHLDAQRHLHDEGAHHLPALTADHDHHEHESRALGAGVMSTRDPGSIHAHLVAETPPRKPSASCARTFRSASQAPDGVGPPGEPGLLPYLHCSLLI